jgi:hypothetical protein
MINGPYGLILIFLVMVIVIMAIMCVRTGLIRVKTDTVEIGNTYSERERTIIRNQIQYINMAVEAFEHRIPKDENYDEDRGKYILQLMSKQMIEWVIFNHIEENKVYIENRQEQLWNIVLANVEKDYLRSEFFKQDIYDYTKMIIHRLVAIRKEYMR